MGFFSAIRGMVSSNAFTTGLASKMKCAFNSEFRAKYVPRNPLIFQNGVCKIYEYSIYKQLRSVYLAMLFAGGLTTGYFADKLLNFKERKWYGLIFYGAATWFLAPKVYALANIFSHIIHDIKLSKCGEFVTISHARFGFLPHTSMSRITNIVRPAEPEAAIQIFRFAYPILINNKVFYLPRDTELKNEEILPVILNGIPIDTNSNSGSSDEIIIE